MSLVIALKSREGIVLGADSRGTVGDPRGLTAIRDSQIKLYAFGKCGIGIAGASEMGNTLLDELSRSGLRDVSSVDKAIRVIIKQSSQAFDNWFRSTPPGQRPGVLLTVAGYRESSQGTNEPMIYLLNSQANFAPQLFGDNPCMSGVPQYAVYLVHRYYDPRISLDKAKSLVEYLISETASQDPKVGGPIKIATITPDNGYEELPEKEIREIHLANEELNVKLREFFMEVG